jgi:hypothetical protein
MCTNFTSRLQFSYSQYSKNPRSLTTVMVQLYTMLTKHKMMMARKVLVGFFLMEKRIKGAIAYSWVSTDKYHVCWMHYRFV